MKWISPIRDINLWKRSCIQITMLVISTERQPFTIKFHSKKDESVDFTVPRFGYLIHYIIFSFYYEYVYVTGHNCSYNTECVKRHKSYRSSSVAVDCEAILHHCCSHVICCNVHTSLVCQLTVFTNARF